MLDKTLETVETPYRLRPQGTWTYQDWLRFPDDGWKYEIIDGELNMTPPPGIGHQRSSIRLAARMHDFAVQHDLDEVLEAPCAVRLANQPVPVQLRIISTPPPTSFSSVAASESWPTYPAERRCG